MNVGRCKAYSLALAAVLLLSPCFAARARQAAPSIEDARVARLVGLAKVWGAVKYFHPSLAYREVDWDKAAPDREADARRRALLASVP